MPPTCISMSIDEVGQGVAASLLNVQLFQDI